MMVFDLATTVKADLSDYDMDGGAWPVRPSLQTAYYQGQSNAKSSAKMEVTSEEKSS